MRNDEKRIKGVRNGETKKEKDRERQGETHIHTEI